MYLIIWAIFLRPKKNQALLGLGNDTFTISKLQVALLAQAREVQARLTELSLDVDTDTPEGLMTLMQEAAIASGFTATRPLRFTNVSSLNLVRSSSSI